MSMKKILSLFSLLYLLAFCDAWIFSPSSNNFIDYSQSIPVPLTGFMSAFGDFNADRTVDIFLLDKRNNVQVLDVILMGKENKKSSVKRITLLDDKNNSIRNVIVGDFDGDSLLDVVTINSANIKGPYTVDISYGVYKRDSVKSPIPVGDYQFISQPLHVDWNTDMIGDLFGQTIDREFIVLLGINNQTFIMQKLPELSTVKLAFDELLFSYFVDIDQIGETDILLVGRKHGDLVIVSVLRDSSTSMKLDKWNTQYKVKFLGQPVIADFLFNGKLQMIIPMCSDDACNNSQIIACKFTDRSCVINDFARSLNGNTMNFKLAPRSESKLSLLMPEIVPMSCGDVKMTGKIGCLVIVYDPIHSQSSTLVRLNNKGDFKFDLVEIEGQSDLFFNVSQAAIFDLEENGVLDIITASQSGNSGMIRPLLQDASGDSYFIKVMVLNGLCDGDLCPGQKLPYGIPLPGSVVSYSTDGTDGDVQSSLVSMVSTTSYSSLMLPFAFFGLNTFSNYIEKLVIQLHYKSNLEKHTLTFIVPKTQIVIIPSPLNNPDKWKNKLYLEPFADKKVIYVAASLLGTMFIVSIVLCILQYLEVREDRLEKMQEAQKFNFDAM